MNGGAVFPYCLDTAGRHLGFTAGPPFEKKSGPRFCTWPLSVDLRAGLTLRAADRRSDRIDPAALAGSCGTQLDRRLPGAPETLTLTSFLTPALHTPKIDRLRRASSPLIALTTSSFVVTSVPFTF